MLLKLPRFTKLRDNDKAFGFCISLLSTFIGFFFALCINTHLNEMTQKENLVKVLKASNLSLENNEMKIQGMYINPALSGQNLSDIIKFAPLELPKMYSSLETNTLVSDYFSSNAFQAYILCNDNMQSFIKRINTDGISDERRIALLEDYKKYVKLAKNINNIELKLLQGKINSSDETKQLQQISKDLTVK